MIKVSVIMPVYNGESHLEQCLDSVCGQTLRDIEILCVDDGSTDASPVILKRYQDADPRIQIFHQANRYAGAARNLGMGAARGKYLMFWDCDDFFEPTALEKMYARSEETAADICVCGVSHFYEKLGVPIPSNAFLNPRRVPDADVFNLHTNEDNILSFTQEVAWNKMFRRAFIEESGLTFQEIRNGNDVFFVINALCMADRIATVQESLINYRKNQLTSLTGTMTSSPITPFKAWVDTAESLQQRGLFPETSFVNRVLIALVSHFWHLPRQEEFIAAAEYVQSHLDVLRIQERDADFYYTPWHFDFVDHLIHDTPEELHVYMNWTAYAQLTERTAEKRQKTRQLAEKKAKLAECREANKALRAQLKETKTQLKAVEKQLTALQTSKAYKLGSALVYLPKKTRDLFRKS